MRARIGPSAYRSKSPSTKPNLRRAPCWWAVAFGPRASIRMAGIEDADREIEVALAGPGCSRDKLERVVYDARAREHLVVLVFRSRADAESFVADGRVSPLDERGLGDMLDSIAHLTPAGRLRGCAVGGACPSCLMSSRPRRRVRVLRGRPARSFQGGGRR
jgi:hypothetical protein